MTATQQLDGIFNPIKTIVDQEERTLEFARLFHQHNKGLIKEAFEEDPLFMKTKSSELEIDNSRFTFHFANFIVKVE